MMSIQSDVITMEFTNQLNKEEIKMEFKQLELVEDKMVLNKLKELFDVLDYISDTCDYSDVTDKGKLECINLVANGELSELEELIIKLENKNK